MAATTSWGELAGAGRAESPEQSREPAMGTLEEVAAIPLAKLLALFTATPHDCYFAMWAGYAGVTVPAAAESIILPPEREMYVYAGAVEDGAKPVGDQIPWRTPIRWWPNDHAWCVGADIYSRSVIVAGSDACISAILRSGDLEAFRIDPDCGIEVGTL
jgi:hypothetical protein